MEIARRLQRFRFHRDRRKDRGRGTNRILHPAVVIALLVFCSISGAEEAAEPPALPVLESWLRELAAANFETREEASQRFLAAGAAAVPFLRSKLGTGDPEVRARIRWLLDVLDPARGQLRLLRLGVPRGEPPRPLVALEWASIDLVVGEERTVTTSCRDGIGVAIHATLVGEGVESRALLHFENAATGESVAAPVGAAGCRLLHYEEETETEWLDGALLRSARPTLWLAITETAPVASPEANGRDESAQIVAAAGAALFEQVRAADRRVRKEALHLSSLWVDSSALPEPESFSEGEEGQVDLAIAWLARDRRDPMLPFLEQWLASDGEAPEDSERAFEAALVLGAHGSRLGQEKLLERIPSLERWESYRAIRAFCRWVESHPSDERILEFFKAVEDPAVFIELPWDLDEMAYLWQMLQERIPAARMREALLALWAKSLETVDFLHSDRVSAMFRTWMMLPDRKQIPIERWYEPVLSLLETPHYERAFVLLREARLDGRLGGQAWQEVLATIRKGLEADIGLYRDFEPLLNSWSYSPAIDAEEALQILLLRLEFLRQEQGSARINVDRELAARFGQIEPARPPSNNHSAWLERYAAWKEVLLLEPVEELRNIPGTWPLRLIEVEFRIDSERRVVECLRFQNRELLARNAYSEPDRSAADRSTVLLPPKEITGTAEHGWEFLRRYPSSLRLSLGVPGLEATARRNRHGRTVIGEKSFAARPAGLPRRLEYMTLYLLADTTQLVRIGDWPALRKWLTTQVPSLPMEDATATPTADELAVKGAWLEAIETLNLGELLPRLQERFLESRDPEIALVLVKMGDASVRGLLLDNIRENGAKNFTKVRAQLVDLLVLGDADALELTLGWLRESPPAMRPWRPTLLNALEIALSDPNTALDVHDERLFAAIIPALDEKSLGNSVRILKKRTGLDFGFGTMDTIPSGSERSNRSREIIAAWQAWYAERAAGDKKDAEPDSK